MKFWVLWLDYDAKRLAEAEVDHPLAKLETVAKRRIFKVVGNVKNLKLEKLDFLKPIHEDAHLKNLRKIQKTRT